MSWSHWKTKKQSGVCRLSQLWKRWRESMELRLEDVCDSSWSKLSLIKSLKDYPSREAVPYIDWLSNGQHQQPVFRQSSETVSCHVCFPPCPAANRRGYGYRGMQQIESLANFYDREAIVVYPGISYTSSLLLDWEELFTEWKVFRRVLYKEKLSTIPIVQEVPQSVQAREAYKGIFPQTFVPLNILLARPIGTATVQRSFSQVKNGQYKVKESAVPLQPFSATEDCHRETRTK